MQVTMRRSLLLSLILILAAFAVNSCATSAGGTQITNMTTIISVPGLKNAGLPINQTLTPGDLNIEVHMETVYVHVCSGGNVPDNSQYSTSQAKVHPLIIFTPNGKLDATYWVRHPGWKPIIVRTAELVLCQGYPESIQDHTCTYGKNTKVPVFNTTYPMTLMEINSGNIIAKKDFISLGSCPIVLTNKNIGLLKGEFPTDEIDEWLKEYVE